VIAKNGLFSCKDSIVESENHTIQYGKVKHLACKLTGTGRHLNNKDVMYSNKNSSVHHTITNIIDIAFLHSTNFQSREFRVRNF